MSRRSISNKTKYYNTQIQSGDSNSDFNDTKLQLREENLDISKEKIKTGEVNIYKEIIKEMRTITIPVIREEIVIEKNVFAANGHDDIDIIRIPIIEEQIEIIKHPVVLENVDIYSRKYQDIHQFEEIIKKEKLRIQTIGDAKVTDIQLKDIYS